MQPQLAVSCRTRRTFFSPRVEALGVKSYTVYNHMLLPAIFRSLEEDYWHLRRHVQLWDVGCERQVELRGPDAARLVQLMTPRDLGRAATDQCLFAPLVDRDGRLINDPVVLKLAEDRYWLSISDSDVLLWANGLASGIGLDVAIEEADVCPLAVQGPRSDDLMAAVFGEAVRAIRFFRFAPLPFERHELIVARSGWSRQGGFEIYVDDREVGLALWDALWEAGQPLEVGPGCPNLIERIEGGLSTYGSDISREHNPLECNMERFCNLDRPIDFIGREALTRIAREGVRCRLRGIRFEGVSCTPCVEPWPVLAGAARIGAITSAAHSPRFACNIGLAMLDREHWAAGTPVEVKMPDGPRPGVVADLPFA